MEDRQIKKCRVCGDKALSFNFNGLVCEPCKIFFRRNAFNNNLKCYSLNNCRIDIETRKSCKLCRLNKCFAIGMKKDLIIFRKHEKTKSESKHGELYNILKLDDDFDEENKNIEELSMIEENLPLTVSKINKFSRSSSSTVHFEHNIDEKQTFFRHYDSHCLELIKKISALFSEKAPVEINVLGYATDYFQVFNAQQCHVPLMLAFANSMKGFKSLPQQDQLIIFKTAFPDILLLRSAFFFNIEKNAFLMRTSPTGESALYVKLETIYPGCNREEAVRLHRKVAFKVRDEMEGDTVIRDLLSVLLLFKPKASLTQQEYVRYQYFSYCHILRTYLSQFKYANNPRKAMEKYLRLRQLVQDVADIRRNTNRHLIASDRTSDVLNEIYYLNDNS